MKGWIKFFLHSYNYNFISIVNNQSSYYYWGTWYPKETLLKKAYFADCCGLRYRGSALAIRRDGNEESPDNVERHAT